ncbi:MAG TPA: heme exporter protein CcmB [Gammaproteobacteria bacterium]|nr:heme exporter protein CcmB [Gammaproteobacteria bacterium]
MLKGILWREWRLLWRARSAIINPLAFLILSTLVFALAAPEALMEMSSVASGLLWAMVLLTQLLSLDAMFRRDYDSGMLEQSLLCVEVPFICVLARIFMQWLGSGFIIAVVAPALGLLLGLPLNVLPVVVLSLLLGTPALSLIGSIGAALTVGFSRGGVVLALIVLPLFLPVLIFGTDLITAAQQGDDYALQAYLLALISVFSLAIGPFAALAGLRISLELR